ncbi:MAG: hypothetical protein AB7N76_13555 [Planctomycetota bacterium]
MVAVSEQEELAKQIEEARDFLAEHENSLGRALLVPGVEKHLDFGHSLRLRPGRVAVQVDEFSAGLLAQMARLGLDLVVSLYP